MIIEERQYTEQEYITLIKKLMVADDLDKELQHHRQSVLNSNPKFYLMLFQKLNAMRGMVELPGDVEMLPLFSRLEKKLYEHTNILPAELPDSVLNDRHLIRHYLADDQHVHFKEKAWNSFEAYIRQINLSIPQNLQLPFLNWCLDMLTMNYERHKKICGNPERCSINPGYERRQLFIQKYIDDVTSRLIEPIKTPVAQPERAAKQANKIQWLGSQKELAELFVELQKKGWIEKFENEAIQDCFAESKSIPQYLKPGTDTKSGEQTFENLYNGYVPQFMNMRENPKRRK